jgi:hypothetical protein
MSLLDTTINEATEETTGNTETGLPQEQVLEGTSKTEGQEEQPKEDWLESYKSKIGEEWSDKHENLIKKFTKDGQLDTIELLKAHRNLEKSFSEKRQAPEKYEVVYDEEVSDFKIDENDELYSEFLGKAKEMNLLNDQVNGILNLLANHVKKSSAVLEQEEQLKQQEITKKAEELKQTIPNFDKRAKEIKNFLLTKLDKDEFAAFANGITSETHMRAVEKLMEMNRDPVIPTPNNTYTQTDGVKDQIRDIRNKINEAAKNNDIKTQRQLDAQLYELYQKMYNK